MMFECIDKIYPSVSIDTVTGSICNFTDNIGGLPLKSCTSLISGYQEGSGTPSPDNVRPLHAFSSANICNVSDYGSYFRGLYQGTYGFADLGSLTWYLNAAGQFYTAQTNPTGEQDLTGSNLICSDKYTGGNAYTGDTDKTICIVGESLGRIWIKDSEYSDVTSFKNSLSGVYLIYKLKTPSTPITPQEFATLCQAFGITGNTYTFTFGHDIYQGYIDWKRGVVVATWGYIASYNGETLTGEWLCDKAEYIEGTTPPIGSQVAYELATPIEIPLGGINLLTQQGQNNIYCDTGNTTVEYIKIV